MNDLKREQERWDDDRLPQRNAGNRVMAVWHSEDSSTAILAYDEESIEQGISGAIGTFGQFYAVRLCEEGEAPTFVYGDEAYRDIDTSGEAGHAIYDTWIEAQDAIAEWLGLTEDAEDE